MTTYKVAEKAPDTLKHCVHVSYYHESAQTRIQEREL